MVNYSLSGAVNHQEYKNSDADVGGNSTQLQEPFEGFFLIVEVHATVFMFRHFTLPFILFCNVCHEFRREGSLLPAAHRHCLCSTPDPRFIMATLALDFTVLVQVVQVPVGFHQCQTVFPVANTTFEKR